jgi:hypothetical protein
MSQLEKVTGLKLLGKGKGSIATVTTTYIDFGTPDDINLAALAAYAPHDRVLVVIHGTTAGTTDTTAWVVKDAPDASGSIGAIADADVTVFTGALAGATGDQVVALAVNLKSGRPWLRVGAVRASGTTDTVVFSVSVYALPTGN